MADVIPLNPPLPEAGFLTCPACAHEDGRFLPVCRFSGVGVPFLAALVCAECESEVPVREGWLRVPGGAA
jgi:hypothetical protein